MKNYLEKITDIREFVRLASLNALLSNYQEHFPHQLVEQTIEYPNQFFYIVDIPKTEIAYTSKNIEQVLGYERSQNNIPFLYEKIHPEDLPIVLEAVDLVHHLILSKSARPFINSIHLDYRIKHQKGHYIRLLRQSTVTSVNQYLQPLYYMSTCTDITSHKPTGKVEVKFYGDDFGNQTFDTHPHYQEVVSKLNAREHQVLVLLKEGKTSEQIGKELFISKNTVDTHRRNMLRKTETKNTMELISFAEKIL
jgi:DNA-binding CsgD family transcriptional regulator